MRRTKQTAVSFNRRTVNILTLVTLITALYSSGNAQSAACLQALRATATTLVFMNACNETEGTNINFQYTKTSDSTWKSATSSEKNFYYLKSLDPDTGYDARIVTSNATVQARNSTCKRQPPPVRNPKQEEREGYIAVRIQTPLPEYPQCNKYYKVRYHAEGSEFTPWKKHCYQEESGRPISGNTYRCEGSTLLLVLRSKIEEGRYHNIEIVTVRYGADNETSEVVRFRAFAGPIPAATTPAPRAPQGRALSAGHNTTQLPPAPSTILPGRSTATTPISTSTIAPRTSPAGAGSPPGSLNAPNATQLGEVPRSMAPFFENSNARAMENASQNVSVPPTVLFVVILTSAVLMAIVAWPKTSCFSERDKLNINVQPDRSTFIKNDYIDEARGKNEELRGASTQIRQNTNKFKAIGPSREDILNSDTEENISDPSNVVYDVVYAGRVHPPTRMQSGSMPKNATIHRGTHAREPNLKLKIGKVVLPPEEVLYENTLQRRNNATNNDFKTNQSPKPTWNIKQKHNEEPEVLYENTLKTAGSYQQRHELCPSQPESVLYENSIKDLFPPAFRLDSPSVSMASSTYSSPEVRAMIQDEASSFVYLNISNVNPTSEVYDEQTYANMDDMRKY